MHNKSVQRSVEKTLDNRRDIKGGVIMYINPIKSLNQYYINKINNITSFRGSVATEDAVSKQTLDNTQFKRSANLKADEFTKSTLPTIRKPNSKNEASSFTNNDLDKILYERRHYI